MKNKEMYFERLLKTADHIASYEYEYPVELRPVRMVNLEKNHNVTYNVMVFQSAFEDLPAIFEQWYWDPKTDEPKCTEFQGGSVHGAAFFFGLDLDSFLHLFAVRSQKPRMYFGDVLTEQSTHPDIAHNITEYVKLMRIKAKL